MISWLLTATTRLHLYHVERPSADRCVQWATQLRLWLLHACVLHSVCVDQWEKCSVCPDQSNRGRTKKMKKCGPLATADTVAQWLNPWLKRPKTPNFFSLKLIFLMIYFVSQSCGMTNQSISEGLFIVLCPQFRVYSRIVRIFCLNQNVSKWNLHKI